MDNFLSSTVPVQGTPIRPRPEFIPSTTMGKLLKPSEIVPAGCPSVCTLRRITRVGLVASGATIIVGMTAIALAATSDLTKGAKIAYYMGGGLLIMSGLSGLCNLILAQLQFNNHEETLKTYHYGLI